MLRAGKDYRALFLNGSGSPLWELGAAAVIGRRRLPPQLIVADCVWGSGGSGADRLTTKAGLRLLDGDHVHYCVHSAEQKRRFPELWGVTADRVHVTPYYYTLRSRSWPSRWTAAAACSQAETRTETTDR